MEIVDIPAELITPAPWNSNEMDEPMFCRLRRSITRFGPVLPLVVREVDSGRYEIIGGCQRFQALVQAGLKTLPCVVVAADNIEARLLSQALNRIQGSDNLGIRAELLRQVLSTCSSEEVLAILPETEQSLAGYSVIGQQSLGDYLKIRENELRGRLHHLTFQLTSSQIKVVEQALDHWLPRARKEPGNSPNNRGTALYLFCQDFLEREDNDDESGRL